MLWLANSCGTKKKMPKMHFPWYSMLFEILELYFGQTHKFTILLIIFIPYYIKVNVVVINVIKSCYVPFNYNKITTTTKWKGWKNTNLLHPFSYNKKNGRGERIQSFFILLPTTRTQQQKWKEWNNIEYLKITKVTKSFVIF